MEPLYIPCQGTMSVCETPLSELQGYIQFSKSNHILFIYAILMQKPLEMWSTPFFLNRPSFVKCSEIYLGEPFCLNSALLPYMALLQLYDRLDSLVYTLVVTKKEWLLIFSGTDVLFCSLLTFFWRSY